jgi:hypothetical protein
MMRTPNKPARALAQPMVDLEREVMAAVRLARDKRVAPAIDALNLRIDAASWGVGFVEIDDGAYQPSTEGDAAFIVAAEAQGELVDLVACRLRDRTTATRMGIAAALGEDAIDIARWNGQRLLLYADPLAWAQNGFRGATIVDWRHARFLLADVPDIACANVALARRLHGALTVPPFLPKLSFVRAA